MTMPPSAPGYQPVDAIEAAAMLRAAGAPEPWARPERLPDLVNGLDLAASLRSGVPEALARSERLKEAAAAIATLRRVLPDLIRDDLSEAFLGSLLVETGMDEDERNQRRAGFLANAGLKEKVLQLLRTLGDLQEPPPPARESPLPIDPDRRSHWHDAAALLLIDYNSVVGSAAITSNGPALRFVQAALDRTGYVRTRSRSRSLGAIEIALKRYWITTNWPEPFVVRTPPEG